jgi:hypothetical protein
MKHFIILVSIFTLFSVNVKSQNTLESIGLPGSGLFRGLFLNSERYNLIRTDEFGDIKSISDISNSKLDSSDLNESSFIIYGYTTIKNGKITSKSSDYDYWLVLKEESINSYIFPNPTSSKLYVFLNGQLENSEISIYDIRGRLVVDYSLNDNLTELSVNGLQPGYYICKIYNNKTLIKTEKLCII